MRTMKTLLLPCVGALALALSGCGGGSSNTQAAANPGNSGGDTTPPVTPGEPPGPDTTTPEGQRMALMMAEMDLTTAEGDLAQARKDLVAAEKAVTDLADDASAADRKAAEMARDEAKMARDQAVLEHDEAERAWEMAWNHEANMDDRAEAKMWAEQVLVPDAPGKLKFSSTESENTFAVTGGVVSDESNNNDTAVEFMESDDEPMMLSGLDGVMGATYLRDATDTQTETVVSYTDKMENGMEEYSKYYNDSRTQADYQAWRGVTAVNDDGELTISASIEEAARGLFQFTTLPLSNQPSATTTTLPAKVDNPETQGVDESTIRYEYAGMFHGVPGTLSCLTGCSVTSMGGMPTAFAGDWRFTPEMQEKGADPYMVSGVRLDRNYLDFGYWTTMTDADGTMKYQAGAFAKATGAAAPALSDVVGNATYEGPATGLFVRKKNAPDGMAVPAISGQFTATASLTAHFGTPRDLAAALHNSISGKVSKFMGDGVNQMWEVELGSASISNTGAIEAQTASNTETRTATTSGGKDTAPGSWSGQFLGGGVDDDDDPATPPTMPEAVTGTFDAHFTDGHVLGAFGAMMKKAMGE